MKGQRRYVFGAAVADLYIWSILIGVVPAGYVALTHRMVPVGLAFGLGFGILVCVVTYHVAIARRVPARTPGEMLMGSVVADGVKSWANPFRIGRGGLFTVIFVSLIIASNSWDSATDEHRFMMLTPSVVIVRALALTALVVGAVLAGMGRTTQGYLMVAYLGLVAIGNVVHGIPGVSPAASRNMAIASLILMIATAVILHRYRRALRPSVQIGAASREHTDVG